jgi:hypothetical protein
MRFRVPLRPPNFSALDYALNILQSYTFRNIWRSFQCESVLSETLLHSHTL